MRVRDAPGDKRADEDCRDAEPPAAEALCHVTGREAHRRSPDTRGCHQAEADRGQVRTWACEDADVGDEPVRATDRGHVDSEGDCGPSPGVHAATPGPSKFRPPSGSSHAVSPAASRSKYMTPSAR